MQKKGSDNAGQRYYQQILSDWGNSPQPGNKDNDSIEVFSEGEPAAANFWEQREFILLVPVKFTAVGVSGNEHGYKVQIPTNVDVSILPSGKGSKGSVKSSVNLPATSRQDKSSISLVYGISNQGRNSLSHFPIGALPANIAYIASRVLVLLHRAIELRLQSIEGKSGTTRTNDSGVSVSPTQAQENVGKHQEAGRGDALRPKVLPENTTEVTPAMDEVHRKMVGLRQANRENRLRKLGNDTDNRDAIEAIPGDG